MGFFVLCIFSIFIPKNKKNSNKTNGKIISNQTLTNIEIKEQVTPEVLENFKTEILKPKLIRIFNAQTKYNLINKKIKSRVVSIQKRFNAQIQKRFFLVKSKKDVDDLEERGLFSANIHENKPFFKINTWKLYKKWISLKETDFDKILIASVFHELIHFDEDNIKLGISNIEFEEFIKEEHRAWTLTVIECLSELNLKQNEPLYNEYSMYINRKSEQDWYDYIAEKYSYRKIK